MKKRGQVSIEYMVVIGFVTLIILSLLLLSRYYSRDIETAINTNQIDKLAKEIVDNAEYIYYFGEPSKTTIKVFIPKEVEQIDVNTNEINFRVATPNGDTDIFYRSAVNLSGTISTAYGFHYLTIEARGGYVWINST